MPKKFIRSFKYAREGAGHALRTQRNIWVHLFFGTLVLAAGIWIKISAVELAVITLTVSFVIVAEMVNTAIEEVVNLAKPEVHPQAALAKNLAAAAVLMAAAGAVAVGVIIFAPRIVAWL